MTAEPQNFDPYEVVLADLRAKRDQIDQAIQAIEQVRSGVAVPGGDQTARASQRVAPDDPGAFLGMTIVDAAKKLLASRRQPLKNADIAAAFKAGGLHLTSAEPANTVGSVLTRRFNDVGDIVKVGRGTWGLAEWYPNRNFKRKPTSKGEGGLGAAPETTTGTSEPEQPSAQPRDELEDLV